MTTEITSASIEWYDEAMNRPKFHIDIYPSKSPVQRIYKAFPLKDGTMYVWEEPGGVLVDYFYENPLNQQGYGGRVFEIQLEDGTKREVKGPWSSRAGCVNDIPGAPKIVDVCIVNDYYRAGAVLAKPLIEFLNWQGTQSVWVCDFDEWTLEPLDQNGKLKSRGRLQDLQIRTLPSEATDILPQIKIIKHPSYAD